jgi:hypothetical protein
MIRICQDVVENERVAKAEMRGRKHGLLKESDTTKELQKRHEHEMIVGEEKNVCITEGTAAANERETA